jgi:hypothetical protein
MGNLAEQIRTVFADSSDQRPVDGQLVLDWIKMEDIEVRGTLYYSIVEQENAPCIEPPLIFADYYVLLFPYLEQCMLENPPETEWVMMCDGGTHLLVAGRPLGHRDVPSSAMELKKRLAGLYKQGDDQLRDAPFTGVLSTFEHEGLFQDWRRTRLKTLPRCAPVEGRFKDGGPRFRRKSS